MKHSASTTRTLAPLLMALTLTFALLLPEVAHAASQASVNKAYRFLQGQERGKEILGFLHFGATYRGHDYLGGTSFDNGSFELVYKFSWDTIGDDDYTIVGFFCDSNGNIRSLETRYTTAIVSQPFFFANASIKILGQMIIDNDKEKLSEDDYRRLQKLVNDADAHALLEWTLRAEQFFGN